MKLEQKILNSMVVEAIQTFQFLRQKSGFLKTIKLCLNFNMGFHIT